MARSKAYLFPDDERLGSQLSSALAHPARFQMMVRLLRKSPVSYLELIEGIPLAESTVNSHLRAILKLRFALPAPLSNGSTGYCMNIDLYNRCTGASRRLLSGQGRVILMESDDSETIAV